MPISLGLLGAASITSRSIIRPAQRSGQVRVHAIAASEKTRAARFALEHRIPLVFASYEAMLECDEIEAVYLALPNHLHAKWAVAAARAKKHVLVEKPLCLDVAEAERIRGAVRESRVELLEGVMTQHHPWESRLRAIVAEERLGSLVAVKTALTFRLARSENYRFSRRNGGGVFLDESCYWLRLLQVLGLLPLERLEYEADVPDGCEVETSCGVRAVGRGGVAVEAIFSYERPYEATHLLVFSEGTARIRNFLAPSLGDFRIRIEMANSSGEKEVELFERENYFANQLDFFARVVRGERDNVSLDESIERIRAMEAVACSAMNGFKSEGPGSRGLSKGGCLVHQPE